MTNVRPRAAWGLLPFLAFSTVLLEVSLTRLFSALLPFHFIAVAVALALLGLGLGAWLELAFSSGENATDSWAGGLLVFSAALLLSVALLPEISRPWMLFGAALIPFVAAGTLISSLFTALSARRAYGAYAADLAGAALGAWASAPLAGLVGPEALTAFLAALSAAAAAAVGRGWKTRLAAGLLVLIAAAAGVALASPRGPDLAGLSPLARQKPLRLRLSHDGGRIVDHLWGAAGRADLYEDPAFPEVKWLYNDEGNSSLMLSRPEGPVRAAILQKEFAYIPFAAAEPRRVTVIGAGAGYDVALARAAGAEEIDAVELSPAAVEMVRRWEPFAGPVYAQPGVRARVEEGRRFVERSPGGRDLLMMSLVLSASAQSGAYALTEGRLYTVEAFSLYFSRLAPGGLLTVVDDSRERTLRQSLTALRALERRGVPPREAPAHLAVFYNAGDDRTGYKYMLAASPAPFPPALARRLAAEAAARGSRTLFMDGVAAEGPYQLLAERGAQAFLDAAPRAFRPVPDDAPYFFDFSRNPREEWGLLKPSLAVAALAAIAALAMALRGGPAGRAPAGTAFLLGVGFMLAEIGLLQRLTAAAGGPLRVLPLLLFSLLLWCGAGSLAAAWKKSGVRACALVAAAALLATDLWAGRPGLFRAFPSHVAAPWAIVLFLAPVGIALGAPFPTLLGSTEPLGRRAVGWLWGVNGLASVTGSMGALAFSQVFGTQALLLLAAAWYLLTGLLTPP